MTVCCCFALWLVFGAPHATRLELPERARSRIGRHTAHNTAVRCSDALATLRQPRRRALCDVNQTHPTTTICTDELCSCCSCCSCCSTSDIPPLPSCLHSSWAFVDRSGPGADGLGECTVVDCVCSDCRKVLATQYSCISATWYDVFDDEWARRPNAPDLRDTC
jgi:hypothetical protein